MMFRTQPIVTFFALATFADAALVDIDFNAGSEFAANFRDTSVLPFAGHTVQTGGHVTADHSISISGSHYQDSFIYDTTPESSAVQNLFSGAVTISMDVRAAQAGSSAGFFIVNPSETGSQQLAFFNWDNAGGTDERIRISNDTTLTQASINTTVFDQTADGGTSAGSGLFTTITLQYWEGSPGEAFMNFTAGSFSSGNVSLGPGSFLPQYQIAIRVYDGIDGSGPGETGGVEFDNFRVVPEPSVVLVAAASSLTFFARRRRTLF